MVVYDDLSRGWRDMVRWGPLVEGDIRDTGRLESALTQYRPAVVAHFAAVAYVGESVSSPAEYYDVNVLGTLSLLEAMRRQGLTAVILSSSCATYGHSATIPLDEDAVQAPINPYGWSKLFSERLILDCAQTDRLDYAILRYFNAAGASPDGDIGERHEPEPHLIPLVLEAALNDRATFTIYGGDFETADGTCIRDFVHVSDLARAHALAASRLIAGGGSMIANLGSGAGTSVRRIVEAVQAVTGRSVPLQVGGRRPGDPAVLVASAARAKAQLGWSAASNPEAIIRSAYAWALKERERQGDLSRLRPG